jgi:hypothetical protein
MDESRRDTMKAGLIGVLVVVSLALLIFFLSDKGVRFQVVFDHARGLESGDCVYFKGIRVGSVESLEIEGDSVRVSVVLNDGQADKLTGRIGFLLGTENLLLDRKAIFAVRYDRDGEGIQPGSIHRGFDNRGEFWLEVARHSGDRKLRELKEELADLLEGVNP